MTAYDPDKIKEQALEAIKKHRLFFIEDVVAYLPCSKSTFYEYFPNDSDALDDIKEALYDSRIKTKSKLRKNWEEGAPALQLALYKLASTPEELKKLSMQQIDHTTKGESINLTREERDAIIEKYKARLNESNG
jgi:type II secretory pathway component PulL